MRALMSAPHPHLTPLRRHLTSQASRFGYAIANLPPEAAAEVRDVIIHPHAELPYDTLRYELIRRTSASEECRSQQLLNSEEIGDRQPTQLLRRMRDLAGNPTTDDSILRQLFLQRLPHNARMILAAGENSRLDDLAKMADRILDFAGLPPPGAVAALVPRSSSPPVDVAINEISTSLQQLQTTVAALANRVDAIPAQRPRSPRRSFCRRCSPSRYRSPSPSQHQFCWYHRWVWNLLSSD
ncbi:uncharacterized protein LOC135367516 [Ornithodoros turicata]|uniref:uncharacterized protein LOC135367516 n=1 Tax=Ornithodoros turicata TaxID=34597 RepID=UPI003138E740